MTSVFVIVVPESVGQRYPVVFGEQEQIDEQKKAKPAETLEEYEHEQKNDQGL